MFQNKPKGEKLIACLLVLAFGACDHSGRENSKHSENRGAPFPDELVHFTPYSGNPVFSGTNDDTWDEKIRERGYILKEKDGYHLWYTGYRKNMNEEMMTLGYATSADGISWTRHPDNPVFTGSWVEDMMVIKRNNIYYMFAEGSHDIAHILMSEDKIHWEDLGSIDVRQTSGDPLSPGPYGTPTAYVEGDVWHLFYERNDLGIWHATSSDLKVWRNVQDEPVIQMGPDEYDRYGVALNQIIRHGDHYYAYYHGTPTKDWSEWNTNVAISDDLITWTKYPGNPILEENKSSGIILHDGQQFRMYTMHDQVQLHFPSSAESDRRK